MANLSDIEITPVSGLLHIDALLDIGPDWNFLTTGGNTIFYTFSIASGNEDGQSGQQAFDATQQITTRTAFAYISELTGIEFVETSNGSAAQVHLSYVNIEGASTTGLTSWMVSYSYDPNNNELTSYVPQAYIYLDNAEWNTQNRNLLVGTASYETLLHELGHMLGLKHPFDDDIVLPSDLDTPFNTLMSYESSGLPDAFSTFSPYDVAALNWLYGGDGLGGALGIGSSTGARYITGIDTADTLTGTSANDVLQGAGGDDFLHGGAGQDSAIFGGLSADYLVVQLESGRLQVVGADGNDTLDSIELLQFDNGTFAISALLDLSAPAAPVASVSKNAAGYVKGNTPVISGTAEAHATIKIMSGSTLVASGQADAVGAWSLATVPLADGSVRLVATATDASGNVSPSSAALSFLVDTVGPAAPSAQLVIDGAGMVSGNQPVFSGQGGAGLQIELHDAGGEVIGQAQVSAGGSWSITPLPLANGQHTVTVFASDLADNATAAIAPFAFQVQSAANRTGSDANDQLLDDAGSNAFAGGAGIDTALYAGARANYTIVSQAGGYSVTDTLGVTDMLRGVERITFADASVAIDIDGNGGQAYRLYQAAFDRTPDVAGLAYWIDALDLGTSLENVAFSFVTSKEFGDLYGSNLSDAAFADQLYQNVLHRTPDEAGLAFWVDSLALGVTRATVLFQFSESAENQAQLIGTIENGFVYA